MRFGSFELDVRSRELRNAARRWSSLVHSTKAAPHSSVPSNYPAGAPACSGISDMRTDARVGTIGRSHFSRSWEERARERYVPRYFPALVLSGLGRNDHALDQLEAAPLRPEMRAQN